MTVNTLKTCDDHLPLQLAADGDRFKLQYGSKASWLSAETFGHKELRNRIEPWLTSLFQSEHMSLLAGSGLTHAVHYLAAGKCAAGMDALTLWSGKDGNEQAVERTVDWKTIADDWQQIGAQPQVLEKKID